MVFSNRAVPAGRHLRAGVCVLAFLIAAGCGSGDQRQHTVAFVHATDPHIFLASAQDQNEAVKSSGQKQQDLDERALSDLLRRIPSLPDAEDPPAFLALTGNLGVDPCPIARDPAADCADVDAAKRQEQIQRIARVLRASPVTEIYLVAGNHDVAHELPGDSALAYFNQWVEDVQAKLVEDKSGVRLHNLTRCYAPPRSGSSSCYADVADTSYRLIGFPSYSFQNKDVRAGGGEAQARQFETFRALLEEARRAGKKVLVLSNIPEIDDPYVLAQDRYAGKTPRPANDKDASNPRSPWSTWNVSRKLLEDWNDALASDSVAGVLAGHLRDPHREMYRQPYPWSTIGDRRMALRKLMLAPPLGVRDQDASPLQARGFSWVRLEPDHIAPQLYWYNPETGDFRPDARPESHPQPSRWPRAITWLWNLADPEKALERLAVLLIAFLAAFLTVVQIWQIPPAENPLAPQNAGSAPAFEPSPFASNFGKTVIAGLGGLAAETVLKAWEGKPSGDDKEFYVVWFVIFFFTLLLVLAALRSVAEAVRSRVAIVHYPLVRPAYLADKTRHRFQHWFAYWWLRIVQWVFSLRVPLLTLFDTFINLIQGKNQTMTQAFTGTIIGHQRTVIRVADSIRTDLNELIERRLRDKQAAGDGAHVRVNISVLSADQTNVFYIARAHGSARDAFPKRSMAWVSVFTGEIRWYKPEYSSQEILLFDNRTGLIAGDEKDVLLSTHYQARPGEDYQAFIVLPVPWPRRGFGSEYVRGAIQISFKGKDDFERIWGTSHDPLGGQRLIYPAPQRMLEEWCDPEVRAALRNSLAALGELLRGFNETIYRRYIEPHQFD